MKEKKILVIAYFFPPHSGAGVQRPLRFVRQLIEDGWKVTVISSDYSYMTNDKSLSKKIPDEVKIYYLNDVVNKFFLRCKINLLSRIYSYLAFPDRMLFWYLLNKKKIRKIAQSDNYSVCLSTSFPYTSHYIGTVVKRIKPETNHIVDYRDAWSSNPSIAYTRNKPILYFLSKYLENYINKKADHITTVSIPLISEIVIKNKEKIKVIYNGYDRNDFLKLSSHETIKYNVMFIGSLYGYVNPKLFIKPFCKFLETKNVHIDDIRLSFIGDSRNHYLQMIKDAMPTGLELIIEKYKSHDDILQDAQYASLLLLLIDMAPGTEGIVTGKLLEYINLFAPILGIVPLEGAASSIIKSTKTGTCFSPGDERGIHNFLITDYLEWKNDKKRLKFNSLKNCASIKKYSEESQYKLLKNLLGADY